MPRWLRPQTFRARDLRRTETPAERALWALLRGRRLENAKFRRQQPLGSFYADFVCFDLQLVVEADGAHHFPRPQRDVDRDRFLQAAGFVVLRLPNRLIIEQPDLALARIRRALLTARHLQAQLLDGAATPPSPSGRRGSGG
jgi:very-short-patch-repair endonuclease